MKDDRKTCSRCRLKRYYGTVRVCPAMDKHICFDCCRKCKKHYWVNGTGIMGCRLWDERRLKSEIAHNGKRADRHG